MAETTLLDVIKINKKYLEEMFVVFVYAGLII